MARVVCQIMGMLTGKGPCAVKHCQMSTAAQCNATRADSRAMRMGYQRRMLWTTRFLEKFTHHTCQWQLPTEHF